MNKTIRDPKGNQLVPTVLQVLERGEQGPTLCRVRYDHETINLDPERPDQNTFLIVWAPSDSVLGELRGEDLMRDLNAEREKTATQGAEILALNQKLNTLHATNERLHAENEDKTTALRSLQRERDPERVESAVRERTAELKRQLADVQGRAATESVALRREIEELKASKKKLREALERARNGNGKL